MIAVCLFVSYSASAQTYYNSGYTGAEIDAALLKARDSMLVKGDTTALRTFSNSRYAYKNFMDASDGNPDSALYIDATGQVGIGTTSPGTYKLNVYGGNIQIGSSYSYDISNGAVTFDYNHIGSWSNLPFYIGTNNTSRIYIEAAGNVGIGTTTPYTKLSVISSNATNVNAFNFVDTDVNTNRTTAATARDTSSINGWFSGSGSPTFNIVDKGGQVLFKVDSSGVYGVKDTLTQPWGIMDTVTTGILPGWKVPFDITIVDISSFTDANTTTFNIEERALATPNSAGTDAMASDQVADNDNQVTTSFSNAVFSKDTWAVPTISATGDVAIFSISVRYVKNY